ncbi:hypothetical protein, partial [Bacillus altitudinis]|uniref:hypothetical protein n=1 Tax=Bacillus altitudinis TaxID=293387 RepID=UPI002F929C63
SPDFRFKTHLTDKSSSGKKHKAKMREILAEDSDGVEMRIIEETTAAEASYRERFWIDELRNTHNLTNAIIKHATGGM